MRPWRATEAQRGEGNCLRSPASQLLSQVFCPNPRTGFFALPYPAFPCREGKWGLPGWGQLMGRG